MTTVSALAARIRAELSELERLVRADRAPPGEVSAGRGLPRRRRARAVRLLLWSRADFRGHRPRDRRRCPSRPRLAPRPADPDVGRGAWLARRRDQSRNLGLPGRLSRSPPRRPQRLRLLSPRGARARPRFALCFPRAAREIDARRRLDPDSFPIGPQPTRERSTLVFRLRIGQLSALTVAELSSLDAGGFATGTGPSVPSRLI